MIHNPTEREAVLKVALIFETEFRWTFRNQPEQDFGIDAHVEVVDEGFPTGRLFALQIKSGPHCFREETDRGFVYRGGRQRHVEYWGNHSLPVVLVLYDPTTQAAYWEVVRPELIKKTASGWKITVPKHKRLNKTAIPELRTLATKLKHPEAKQLTAGVEKRDLINYLRGLMKTLSELPPHFGKHFDAESIRQRVRVSTKRLTYLDVLVTALESERRSGYFAEDEAPRQRYMIRGSETYQEVSEGVTIVDWEELRGTLERAVILGDPGFGKTWLLKYEGLRVAQEQLHFLKDTDYDPNQVLLPVFLRLGTIADTLGRNNLNLAWTVAGLVSERCELSPDWVATQVLSGRCVLLFDALDEVEIRLRPMLSDALEHLAKTTQNRILLTSRIVGYKAPFTLRERNLERELEIVAFEWEQTEHFIDNWFIDVPERARTLKEIVRREDALRGLARIPLLLSFICLLAREDQPLPTRRAALYEALISHLLEGRWREEKLIDHNPERVEMKLLLLEEIAWRFAAETVDRQWHDLLAVDDLSRVIADSKYSPFIHGNSAKQVSILLELSERDGLLVKAGSAILEADRQIPYLFLHRTFHEYLAASYLARYPVEDAVAFVRNRWWYDPEWEEVVVLLAGRLANPTPLIEALLLEENDVFNRMLILSGRCIAEVAPIKRPEGLEDYLTDKLIKLVRSDSSQGKRPARRVLLMLHNERGMKALTSLYHSDSSERTSIAKDIIQADTRQGIAMLKEALESKDCHVRERAVTTVAELNDTNARELLWKALDDPQIEIRTQAAGALGDLDNERVMTTLNEGVTGSRAPHLVWGTVRAVADIGGDKAITLLSNWTNYPDKYTRGQVMDGLKKIIGPRVESVLNQVLNNRYPDVRIAAAAQLLQHADPKAEELIEQALDGTLLLSEMEQLGRSLEVDQTKLEGVINCIRQRESSLREAFRAESRFGGEYVFSMLWNALAHQDGGTRWIAAWIICEGGKNSAEENLRQSFDEKRSLGKERGALSRVVFLLTNHKNSKKYLKDSEIYSTWIGHLSPERVVEATGTVQSETSLLDFKNNLNLHQQALQALESIDSLRASEVLVNSLGKSLIRKEVLEAIGKRSDELAVSALKSALNDPALDIQITACRALKNRANEDVFPVLRRIMRAPYKDLREKTAQALGEIAGDESRGLLRQMLSDEDRDVRVAAATALGPSGGDAAVAVWTNELKRHERHGLDHYWAAHELGKIGNEKAIVTLLGSLSSSNSAYLGASVALGSIARGEVAVKVFRHVLRVWPRYDIRKQKIFEDLLSSLAPEVCRTVGDEWPYWRKNLITVIHPPPGPLKKAIVVGGLIC